MSEYLFSYGTLQKKEVQIDLFGRLLSGSADVLCGYKLSTIEIKDETFLAKGEDKYQKSLVLTGDKNDRVAGTVFEISEHELLLADKYEPECYKRIEVGLESGTDAWIYVNAES